MSYELIPEITNSYKCDVFTCGAAYILDELEKSGLIDKNSRRVLGYRRSVILTQKGNPKK